MTRQKFKVFFEDTDNLPSGFYNGPTTHLVASKNIHRGTDEEATLLTQDQAKRLIDKCRHAKIECNAIPGFTITY